MAQIAARLKGYAADVKAIFAHGARARQQALHSTTAVPSSSLEPVAEGLEDDADHASDASSTASYGSAKFMPTSSSTDASPSCASPELSPDSSESSSAQPSPVGQDDRRGKSSRRSGKGKASKKKKRQRANAKTKNRPLRAPVEDRIRSSTVPVYSTMSCTDDLHHKTTAWVSEKKRAQASKPGPMQGTVVNGTGKLDADCNAEVVNLVNNKGYVYIASDPK